MPFAGHYMDENVAFQLALGNLDAKTLEELDTYNPDMVVANRNACIFTKHASIWSNNYVIQQHNSYSSFEPESEKITSFACKQPDIRIEYSILKTAEQVPDTSDNKLKRQYTKLSSTSSLSIRKRTRDEHCSLSQNQFVLSTVPENCSESYIQEFENENPSNWAPLVSDPYAEPTISANTSTLGDFDKTPIPNINQVCNLNTPPVVTKTSLKTSSHLNAPKTFSQLKTMNCISQKSATRGNLQSQNITIADEQEKENGFHSHIAFPTISNNISSQN